MKITIPIQQLSASTGSKRPQPALYFGRLMTPAQVNAAMASHPDAVRKELFGHWTLCGDVQTEMFLRLQARHCEHDMQERITAFSTPAGGSYAVLTQQRQGFQHRFLLPLFEPKIGAFLADMTQGALAYSLANNDAADAVVWRSRFGAPELLPLQVFAMPLSQAVREQVVVEYFRVIKAMSKLEQIPSATQGEVVHHVSLTILMPEETLGQCDKRLMQGLV
jgi:hypothetical protein